MKSSGARAIIKFTGAVRIRRGRGEVEAPKEPSCPALALIETTSARARHHGARTPAAHAVREKTILISSVFIRSQIAAGGCCLFQNRLDIWLPKTAGACAEAEHKGSLGFPEGAGFDFKMENEGRALGPGTCATQLLSGRCGGQGRAAFWNVDQKHCSCGSGSIEHDTTGGSLLFKTWIDADNALASSPG